MKLIVILVAALAIIGFIFLRLFGDFPNPVPHAMSGADFWWLVLVAIAVAGGLVWNRVRTGRWLSP